MENKILTLCSIGTDKNVCQYHSYDLKVIWGDFKLPDRLFETIDCSG